MSETISITRGLVKLKTLKKRIEKATSEIQMTTITVGEKPPVGYPSKEKFKEEVQSKYDSTKDLISEFAKIKSAIVKSNSTVSVDVGKEKMTVAEAIERKNSIAFEKLFLNRLVQDLGNSKYQLEQENESVQNQLRRIIEGSFGGEKNINKTDYDNIATPFLSKNERKMVDPLSVEKIIEKLSEKIQDFEDNVDIALSEVNSRTMIEI